MGMNRPANKFVISGVIVRAELHSIDHFHDPTSIRTSTHLNHVCFRRNKLVSHLIPPNPSIKKFLPSTHVLPAHRLVRHSLCEGGSALDPRPSQPIQPQQVPAYASRCGGGYAPRQIYPFSRMGWRTVALPQVPQNQHQSCPVVLSRAADVDADFGPPVAPTRLAEVQRRRKSSLRGYAASTSRTGDGIMNACLS